MLSNAYFLAKFRFDTAENEPAKKLQNFRKCIFEKCIFEKCIFHRAAPPCHLVPKLNKVMPERNFGRDVRERIPGRLRGQGRGATQAGVDLDDPELLRVRVERVPGLLIWTTYDSRRREVVFSAYLRPSKV